MYAPTVRRVLKQKREEEKKENIALEVVLQMEIGQENLFKYGGLAGIGIGLGCYPSAQKALRVRVSHPPPVKMKFWTEHSGQRQSHTQ